MNKRPVVFTQAILGELAHRAKLNKPSNDWKTSEWDRVVDAVVAAMKKPPPDVPSAG